MDTKTACSWTLPRCVHKRLVKLAIALAIIATTIIGGTHRSAMAATVTLSPGANIQNAVNSNPAGTSFLLNPGVYHSTLTMTKNGDSFIGQPGAVMDGARAKRLDASFYQWRIVLDNN
jgi:hypothetical protein